MERYHYILVLYIGKNDMNYFLIQQYLSELTNSNFIEYLNEDSKEKYSILKKGINTLCFFEDRIPDEIKNELKLTFDMGAKEKIMEKQIVCDSYPKENNQYVVNLKLVENEETLFSIYLDVANEKQANLICKNWKSKPEHIYQSIINVLIEEDLDFKK